MTLQLKSFPEFSIFVVVVVILLLSHNLYEASAASGGRMGGSSFSSEKLPSSSSSSSRRDDDYHHHHHHHHHHYDHYHYSSRISQPSKNANEENDFKGGAVAFLIPASIFVVLAVWLGYNEKRICVLQIQVGLSAKAHSLQKELTEIALTTDTSNAEGWNFILEEAISSLLHHRDCFLYGYSLVTRYWNSGSAEIHFKQLSREEGMKFDRESLVNINNIRMQRVVVPKADIVYKDRIVVTILVAARGAHTQPTIKTTNNVKEALNSLAKIKSSELMAVEVLWSPQDESDSLSDDELLEKYPQLVQLW